MRKFVFLAFAILGLTNIATIYSAIIKADAVYKFPLTFRNNDFEKIVRKTDTRTKRSDDTYLIAAPVDTTDLWMKSLLESRYCVPFLHTRICPEECDKTIDIFYQAFQQHAEHQNRQIQREVYHAQGVDIGFTRE